MSSTGTDIDEIPTDSTPEYHADFYGEEEVELEEEEELILRSEDFISGPFLSENCTVPYDILEFDYSYGYDCKKLFNLVAPEEDTIVFIGGNLIHFMDVKTGNLTFRRSYLGGGLGHITVNPNVDYSTLTVAENGENPPIMIYEWPTMEIVGILKEGAAKRYSHISYSPDGDLLVSQSYGPDFLITVWNWKKWRTSPIILRIKSHVHDVYRCMFSPYVPGHITTGGSGHIKFWKMAQTFTGLKLQGELGRFGKTEISDIVGIFPMPDEKVISGTEWGNLLIWEAGLIKLEVLQTNRRRCHDGSVLQLEYVRDKGEIWSISEDGWARAWDYRVIDEADPPDEDRVVQMVPSYEREIPGVAFRSMCKIRLYDPDCTFYYAQDSNGGIWNIDLRLGLDFKRPKRIKACHAGSIANIAACPWGPYLVSLGIDGRIFVYEYEQKIQVSNYKSKFKAQGRALIWLPLHVDSTGSFFIAGFDDGVVRVFTINFHHKYSYKITQSIKPHSKPVTVMIINNKGSIFVTGGEDGCIFIFQIMKNGREIFLEPIGFVPLGATPTCFTWQPKSQSILLVGGNHGEIFEVDLPLEPVPYTRISFLLHTIKPIKRCFTTCKAQIRRDIHIAEIEARKADKLTRKMQEILQIKEQGIEVDEEIYLQDSEDEEVLEPLHIPEIPNPVLFMMYTPEDRIWLSMGGYDAGYIYEYQMDQKEPEPLKATIIADGDDTEMYGYIYSPNNDFIITSMQNGYIRINRVNKEDFRDLSDYWQLSMHDNYNGRITKMCFSFDKKYFFSAGEDGNLFSYIYKPEESTKKLKQKKTVDLPHINDIKLDYDYDSLSLEEMMIKAEQDKQLRLANEHKKKMRQRLKELTSKLTSLLDRNCKLPRSQRYPLREFIVDERIMKALDTELEAKAALEKRKLAYEVEKSALAVMKMRIHYVDALDMFPFSVTSLHSNNKVDVIVIRGLGGKFFQTMADVDNRAAAEKLKGRAPPRKKIVPPPKELKQKIQELEPFLVGLSPSTIAFKLGSKLTRCLAKYRERKHRNEIRQEQWNALYVQKPAEGENHPDDVIAMKIASDTIGDFKLKSDPNYRVPSGEQNSTVNKYKELLQARLKACKKLVRSYNVKIYNLRMKKQLIIEQLNKMKERLEQIHEEMPENRKLYPPSIPVMTENDFPEKKMEIELTVESDFDTYLKNEREKEKPEKILEEIDCKGVDWEKEALGFEKLPTTPGSYRDIIMHAASYSKKFDPFYTQTQHSDSKETFIEHEMKHRRLLLKIQEQSEIIEEMQQMISNFDKEIDETARERFRVFVDATFLEIHILVLNQELVIIKEFEDVENNLSGIALEKWTEMMDQRDNMKHIEIRIEAHLSNIEEFQEQIKGLQQTFITAAKENKFWDFLRRIFRKKYRAPKISDESESSSSSESSTESEEDETGSIDSRDIGPIRLDESICPKGCDKELYEYTFNLRSRRHELERQIAEEKKFIEQCKKDLEQAAKRVKSCDHANKKAQNELDEYKRLKQMSLNNVDYLVLLNLSQMRHINLYDNSAVNLEDILVFSTKKLKALHKRSIELQLETLEERTKHKRNKTHLHRMTVDCHHMEKTIAKLRKEINERMILKFGSPIKIDEIEEALLRRMILKLRISMLNLGAVYEKEIEKLREIYADKQIEFKNIIRENTARLEILAALNKEKAYLNVLIEKFKEKARKKDHRMYFSEDNEKLSAIVKSQQEQIQMLKLEIKTLSTKSQPLKPITICEIPEKEEPVLEDFGSLDELFEPSAFYKDPELIPSVLDEEKVSEKEIISCVHELSKEIVDSIKATEETPKEMIVRILGEIIEQVPMSYLSEKESLQFMANLIKDLVKNVKGDSQTIVREVSIKTNKSEDEISEYVSNILSMISSEYTFSEESKDS